VTRKGRPEDRLDLDRDLLLGDAGQVERVDDLVAGLPDVQRGTQLRTDWPLPSRRPFMRRHDKP
jgi:hypothetical protein